MAVIVRSTKPFLKASMQLCKFVRNEAILYCHSNATASHIVSPATFLPTPKVKPSNTLPNASIVETSAMDLVQMCRSLDSLHLDVRAARSDASTLATKQLPSFNILPLGCPTPHHGLVFDRVLPPLFVPKEKADPNVLIEVKDPSPMPIVEKHAVRLIVIRRRKMKKHKLRKLRKRMYHVIAKIHHRREVRKEKVFQDELLAQMSRAEEFNAEEWVNEFLRKSTTDPATLIPKKERPVRRTHYIVA